MPFVSIILPYYRKINYVKKTINSILCQSFKDFEIILIYDDEDLHDYIKSPLFIETPLIFVHNIQKSSYNNQFFLIHLML